MIPGFAAWMDEDSCVIGTAKTVFGGACTRRRSRTPRFFTYFYMSGVTFFTLGYGDVTPAATVGRLLAVIETGIGFGFLAGVIGYLPVLYQAFSRRETTIALLDARAGSPPSASQFLLRLMRSGKLDTVDPFLAEWGRWSAELLESHLSFPLLSFYRSQHDNQSWVAALTTILDTCSLLIVGGKEREAHQAQLTFAMARHAAVDLALVMNVDPIAPRDDRLPAEQLLYLRMQLRDAGYERSATDEAVRCAVEKNAGNVRAVRGGVGTTAAVHHRRSCRKPCRRTTGSAAQKCRARPASAACRWGLANRISGDKHCAASRRFPHLEVARRVDSFFVGRCGSSARKHFRPRTDGPFLCPRLRFGLVVFRGWHGKLVCPCRVAIRGRELRPTG